MTLALRAVNSPPPPPPPPPPPQPPTASPTDTILSTKEGGDDDDDDDGDDEFDTKTLFAVRLAPLVDARLDPIVNPGVCATHVRKY